MRSIPKAPVIPFLLFRGLDNWKRQVALVCLAQGVASIGWSFMQPFYPLFIEQELGVDSAADAAFWAGASSGVFALFMGLAGPFWGHFADTYGRKPMLVRAYAAGTLVLMFSGLITNIPQLIGVRILHGGVSGSVGAAMALAGSFVPSNRIPLVVGLLQFTSYFSITISPFIGGQLAQAFGFRTTYFISSGFVFGAGLMILFFVKESFQRSDDRSGSPLALFSETRQVLATKGLLPALLFVPIIQGAPTVLAPVAPGFIQSITDANRAIFDTGLAFGVLGFCSGVSAIFIGRMGSKLNLRAVLIFSCMGASLSLLPQFFNHQYYIFVLLFALSGLFNGAMMTSLSSIVGLMLPRKHLGAAFGILNSASAMAWGLGPLTGGALAWSIGHRRVFLVESIVLAVAGASIFGIFKGIRAPRPAPPPNPAEA